MLTLLLDAAQVFTLAKKSEGKVSLPLCLLTSWYFRYALTLHIAKPGPAYAWHSEPEHITWNHNSEPTKSICCCFENVPNTALTIGCTINVSIDCNGFDVPNLPQKKTILK